MRAAAQLATKVDDTQSWTKPAAQNLLEALDELEPDLLDLVLQRSSLPLNVALVSLPASLHASAVRASIAHAGRLDLSQHQLRCAIVPALGHQLACMNVSIRHLDVAHNHLGHRAAADLSLLLAPLKVRSSSVTLLLTCALNVGKFSGCIAVIL
jgi:hypothetical protein